jgi:hypothetical protein
LTLNVNVQLIVAQAHSSQHQCVSGGTSCPNRLPHQGIVWGLPRHSLSLHEGGVTDKQGEQPQHKTPSPVSHHLHQVYHDQNPYVHDMDHSQDSKWSNVITG